MTSAHAIILALVVWTLPSLAHANAIEDVQVSSDEQDVVVTLKTRDPAESPVVRVAKGMIRLWLRNVTDQPSLRRSAEGQGVAYVEVRPGSDDTAAVRIRLAGRKHLPLSAVRVQSADKTLTLRIAHGLLTATSAASTPAGARDEKLAAPASAAPDQQAKPSATKDASAQPSGPVFAPKSSPATQAKFAPENKASMAALLGVSALLALIYLGVRILQRKHPRAAVSPIEIIATKRLGPRHQLLIVRAFGRDHLLSVQGGTTTRIAGAKAGQLMGAAGEASTAGSFDFEPEPPSEQPAFGADFLRLAIGQRMHEQQKVDEAAARAPTRPAASDAVSGLLRLRREAGL